MDWSRVIKMLSRVTFFVIALLIIVSAFIGGILDIIRTDQDNINYDQVNGDRLKNNKLVIGDEFKHVIWFLQVSWDIFLVYQIFKTAFYWLNKIAFYPLCTTTYFQAIMTGEKMLLMLCLHKPSYLLLQCNFVVLMINDVTLRKYLICQLTCLHFVSFFMLCHKFCRYQIFI